MKKIKYRTEFSNDFNKFVSKAGNGEAVPQYELNDDNVVVPKVDKNGKQVVHNLKADIQKNKKANDYIRLLNSGMDPKDINISSGVFQDTTQAGSGVDLLNAQAKLGATGLSFDQLMNMLVREYQKKNIKQEPKKEQEQKQEQKKDEVN